MIPRYYVAEGKPERSATDLPPSRFSRHGDPFSYRPDPGLVDAVNVALILGQPLLLTGEPGTGKTALAAHIAHQLGLPQPLEFHAKSTSVARDLLYRFDAVARLRAESTTHIDPRNFIEFRALGLAILHANEPAGTEHLVYRETATWTQTRSVVLIDEIDKAPRDFPNDLLVELERLSFEVPEVSGKPVAASEKFRPIVLITSNLEKQLPDAFLRRCIYYHINFPDRDRLAEIVCARIKAGPVTRDDRLDEAIELFVRIRAQRDRLSKTPATAELLGWLEFLNHSLTEDAKPLHTHSAVLLASVSILAKAPEDARVIDELLRSYARV